MKKFLIAGFIAAASLAASAAPINGGLVTGTTPTGIYLSNQNGTQYIPYNQASFTLNGQPIEARYVIDGMNVEVYPLGYGNQYYNNYNNGSYNSGYYNNGYNYQNNNGNWYPRRRR
ncbi:hypothetical protein JST97_04635 [bacterium]|nr:hypothetical protein [bacterium]